jgi:ribonuclease Z
MENNEPNIISYNEENKEQNQIKILEGNKNKISNEQKKKQNKEKDKDNKNSIKKDNSQIDILDGGGNNALWNIWNVRDAFIIPETNYSIKGFSIAALRSNFFIKELGIMLDAGLSMPNITNHHIFITHAHSDHIANLPFHMYGHSEDQKLQVWIPNKSFNKVKDFIESAYIASSDTDEEIKRDELYLYKYVNFNKIQEDQNLELTIKGKKFIVEIIRCYHSIQCLGFGFIEIRQKLKEQYKSLPGKEIGELRKKGVEINYQQEIPFFCYLGDTDKNILNEEKIKKYKTIMIECTFILDDEIEQAEKTKHIHWKGIEDYIKENKHQMFILYHFSQRYKNKEIKDFFDKQNLDNIYPWIN